MLSGERKRSWRKTTRSRFIPNHPTTTLRSFHQSGPLDEAYSSVKGADSGRPSLSLSDTTTNAERQRQELQTLSCTCTQIHRDHHRTYALLTQLERPILGSRVVVSVLCYSTHTHAHTKSSISISLSLAVHKSTLINHCWLCFTKFCTYHISNPHSYTFSSEICAL